MNLLYLPDLESLLTSARIFSIMSDRARLVTPTQGSVSTVTWDQSFISERQVMEAQFCTTQTITFLSVLPPLTTLQLSAMEM